MRTKGKWIVGFEDGFPIIGTEDTIVLEQYGKHLCIRLTEEDAAFICKATNNHDALVEGLGIARQRIMTGDYAHAIADGIDAVLDAIKD